MSAQITWRETLRRGLTVAGILAIADRAVPALAQGETDVPFTDYPANFTVGGNGFPRRTFDHRTLDGLIVPKDKFFVTQNFNQLEIDPNAYQLKRAPQSGSRAYAPTAPANPRGYVDSRSAGKRRETKPPDLTGRRIGNETLVGNSAGTQQLRVAQSAFKGRRTNEAGDSRRLPVQDR